MTDYEGEKHIERMTSLPATRLVHRENDDPIAKPKAEKRTGTVLSCGNKRKADRRKSCDEDTLEQGQRERKRRQREQDFSSGVAQILVVALKNENLASHLKAGDKVCVEPVFNLQTSNSSAPTPTFKPASGEQLERQKTDDLDYIVTLSRKLPKAE